uniref:BHLH domain-containing protein n=1 Tax=Guillardia theta TaxID=55529 RepID=A0A7S4J9P7_GUITH|mmetsp:Transcript_14307/g.48931  ORF Transcript_14307/g.48931 Transcript_14307/m.48931 type:complete len:307 (+) Transcript_14307:278-1198(+)
MEAWRLLFNAALSSACSQAGEVEQGAQRVSQQPQLPHPIPRYLQRDAPDVEKDRGSEQAQGQKELLVNSLPVPPHEQLGLLLRSMSCQMPPFLLGQTPPTPKTRGLVPSAGGGADGEEFSNSEEAPASMRDEVGSERCQRLKEKSMQKKKQRAKKSDLLRQLASLLPPPEEGQTAQVTFGKTGRTVIQILEDTRTQLLRQKGEEEEQAKRHPNVNTCVKKEEESLTIDHTEVLGGISSLPLGLVVVELPEWTIKHVSRSFRAYAESFPTSPAALHTIVPFVHPFDCVSLQALGRSLQARRTEQQSR